MCNKDRKLIKRNSKHVKTTQITAKRYLWDQLHKHKMTDPIEDILKQLENQTQQSKITHNEQLTHKKKAHNAILEISTTKGK